MKKSLKLLLLTGMVASTANAVEVDSTNPNSAKAFSPEYLMNAALDVSQDTALEQMNYSRNAGIKKAQEYLYGISKDVRTMLRNLERHTDATNLEESELGNWVDTWGGAERINIHVSNYDSESTHLDNDIDLNQSFNLTFKFAQEHHVHHLDDVTFRWVPQISETEDGEFSIQGWYCETDLDWVDFRKNFQEPANFDDSAAVGQSVKGQRSMVTRDLPYPFSMCVVAKSDIIPNANADLVKGLVTGVVINT